MLRTASFISALVFLTVAAALFISNSMASAGAIYVTRLDDPAADGCGVNGCALREAIAQANSGPGEQVVVLPPGVITLGSPLVITGNVRIEGAGMDVSSITGSSGRLLEVTGTATLKDMTVRGARGTIACGGGVHNSGILTLDHVRLTDNKTTGQGAGLCSTGEATVVESDISGNEGTHGNAGAGIFNSGTMAVRATHIDGNVSRGVSGGGDAAAVYNAAGASLTIEGSTVSGNTGTSTACDDCSSGAVHNEGTLTVRRTTLDGNNADNSAALQNKGTATVEKSTFSRNTYGSILNMSGASLTVVNSTVSSNHAGPYPKSGLGGISNFGTVSITSSTIADNESTQFKYGGLYNSNQSNQMSIRSSVIARNGQENCSQGGTIVSNGNNVVDDDTCRLNAASDLVVADAGVLPLADNGGPTQTHALEPDSPAIDHGLGFGCASDQRDAPRNPVECDSGSFEYGASPPTPTPAPTPTPEPDAYPMGDFNCNDRIDAGDVPAGLRLAGVLSAPSDCGRDAVPCFSYAGACYPVWNDPDCDAALTPADPLLVIVHLAGAPRTVASCTPVGEMPAAS